MGGLRQIRDKGFEGNANSAVLGPHQFALSLQKIENVAQLFSFLLTVPSNRFLRPDLGVLCLRVYALGFLARGSSQHPNSLSRRDVLLPRHFGEVCGKMLCHQLPTREKQNP